MHLKSISLRGFKSFADRTKINFDSGISIIVGPNGSGKSNITDAALWVLGEQSPSSLRGSAMEDVIFNGSKEKSPLGVAEVNICLDNNSGLLPIEYTEVSIKRRLSRSGESSYYINNNPCRLLDVQELLSDTGLGRDTYCIISQGRLEETLNSHPEEKRLLIEEAAGVLKHKKRKERAERKLKSMEQKLLRVRDVKREVNRQIRPIERQATNAEKYLDLQKNLKEFKINESVLKHTELQKKYDEITDLDERISRDIENMEEEMSELDLKAEEIQYQLEMKSNKTAGLNQKKLIAANLRDRLSSSLILLEEKGKNLVEKLSESRLKIHSLESGIKKNLEELEKLKDEKKKADLELTEKYNLLAELRKKSEQARKERLNVEKEINDVERALLGHQGQVDNIEKNIETLRVNIKNRQKNIESNSLQIDKMKKEMASIKRIITESKNRRKNVRTDKAEKIRLVEEKIESLSDNQAKVSELSQKCEDQKLEISEKKARVKALEEVGKTHYGMPSGTSFLLENKTSGIIGSLDQLIKVKPGYEKAIEAILGIDLYCLVANSRKDIISALYYLEKESKGGATFIALDEVGIKAPPRDMMPETIWAPEIIDCPDEIQPAVNHLLEKATIIDDLALLDGKWGSSDYLMVDKKGALVHPGGKITYGLFGKGETSTFEQKKEIDELKKAIEEAEEFYEKNNNELGESISLSNRLQTEKSNLKDEIHRYETQEEGLNIRIEQAQERREVIDNELSKLKKQNEEHMFNLQREKTQFNQAQQDTKAFRREIEEITLKIEEMKKNANVYYKNEKSKSDALSECQLDIASISQKNVYLKRQVLTFEKEYQEKLETLEVTKNSVNSFEQLRFRVEPLYEHCSSLLKLAEENVADLLKETESEDLITGGLKDTFKQIQHEIKEKSGQLATTKEKKYKHQAEMAAMKVQVNEAVRVIVEDFKIPLEIAINEYTDNYSQSEIENNINDIQAKLEKIGPVNPIAAEEYESLKERQKLLEEQIDDIESSRKALRKIINVIDQKIRDQFVETFELVNKNFQLVFNQLFPGGSAELYLSDPDNLEESGVDVYAQPEGKKLKKMTLLSGGEKSLVAIAVLFALFYTRPSPFYILDEVEPALDDINLTRFIGLIEHLKNKTQFIIISHQRRTMEIADSLYGVSMQADGISRLISQKISDMVEAG